MKFDYRSSIIDYIDPIITIIDPIDKILRRNMRVFHERNALQEILRVINWD